MGGSRVGWEARNKQQHLLKSLPFMLEISLNVSCRDIDISGKVTNTAHNNRACPMVAMLKVKKLKMHSQFRFSSVNSSLNDRAM